MSSRPRSVKKMLDNCDFCEEPSVYEIRGTNLCSTHAIEALEHGADIVVPNDAVHKIAPVIKSDYVYDHVTTLENVEFRLPNEFKEPVETSGQVDG